MSNQNDFLPFASTDTGTNLLTESQYLAAANRTSGNQPGLASSRLMNKAFRQSSFIIANFAQWISNKLTADVLDNANNATILGQITQALAQNQPLNNVSFTTAVAANALTVTLHTQAGVAPSSTDIIWLGMRSATLTTGNYNLRSVQAALSLVVASGATLGMANGVADFLYLYALDNAGTVELGICNGFLDEGLLQTSTALSGSSNSAAVLYSTTARTSVPVRLLGKISITETTAGTWASNATALATLPFTLT